MRDEREGLTKFSFSFIHFNSTNTGVQILNAYIFQIYILAKNLLFLLALLELMYCMNDLILKMVNNDDGMFIARMLMIIMPAM
jgi:hypothetical protein